MKQIGYHQIFALGYQSLKLVSESESVDVPVIFSGSVHLDLVILYLSERREFSKHLMWDWTPIWLTCVIIEIHQLEITKRVILFSFFARFNIFRWQCFETLYENKFKIIDHYYLQFRCKWKWKNYQFNCLPNWADKHVFVTDEKFRDEQQIMMIMVIYNISINFWRWKFLFQVGLLVNNFR